MFTKNDLIDIIIKHISLNKMQKQTETVKRKIFISDWELRRMLKPGQKTINVPGNAIISPLSRDWLDFNGIKIVHEK